MSDAVLLISPRPAVWPELTNALSAEGLTTSLAAALPAARQDPPSVVVIDGAFADTVGLCRTLKADPAWAPVPVVVLADEASEERRLGLLGAGAVDVIYNPYTWREVALRLKSQSELAGLRSGLERQVGVRTAELEAALQANRLLIREVQHRVKNHLSLVAGLLTLTEASATPETQGEVLAKARGRIYALSEVYNLLYRPEDAGGLDLATYVDRLLAPWKEPAQAGVTFTTQVEPLELEVETLVPLGLILNELVTNALKHAFRPNRPGTLRLEARHNGAQVQVTVWDNGPGLPLPPGSCGSPEGGGLGWQLVDSLTAQLKGTWSACNDHGLRVDLKFPLA